MATVVLGTTRCPLCAEVLTDPDDMVLFTTFVPDATDSLARFNDRGFHRSCFEREADSLDALRRSQAFLDGIHPTRRVCARCARKIQTMDDHFLITWLADPDNERVIDRQLGAFNFTHLHRGCVGRWRRRPRLVAALRVAIDAYGPKPVWVDLLQDLGDPIKADH